MKRSSFFILLIVLGSAFGVGEGGGSASGNHMILKVIIQNK